MIRKELRNGEVLFRKGTKGSAFLIWRGAFEIYGDRSTRALQARGALRASDELLVQGGKFFRERTRACLSGSTFGGSCLKLGWVGLGLHLEFHAGDQWVITSHMRGSSCLGRCHLRTARSVVILGAAAF